MTRETNTLDSRSSDYAEFSSPKPSSKEMPQLPESPLNKLNRALAEGVSWGGPSLHTDRKSLLCLGHTGMGSRGTCVRCCQVSGQASGIGLGTSGLLDASRKLQGQPASCLLDTEGRGDFRMWDAERQRLIKCVIKFTERLSKRNAICIKMAVSLSRGRKAE